MRRDLSVINIDPVQWIRVRISDLIDLLYPMYPSLHVVRPDDLLALTFRFVNLKLQKAQPGEEHAWLLPGKNALILVDFQAQNIAEQAYFEVAPKIPPKTGSGNHPDDKKNNPPSDENPVTDIADARLARPSRLVFKVPADEPPIPYTLEALLERCAAYEMNLVSTALPPEPKPPRFALWDNLYIRNEAVYTAALQNYLGAQTEALEDAPHLARAYAGLARHALDPGEQSPAQQAILDAHMVAWQRTSQASGYLQAVDPSFITAPAFQIAAIIGLLKPVLRKPYATETAIEAPFRLLISPNRYGAWAHAPRPVSAEDGTVELWHTRLATRKGTTVSEKPDYYRTIRAVWTRDDDFDPDNPANGPQHEIDDPFRMSLDSTDRHNLVHLTANYHILGLNDKGKKTLYKPEPVPVRRLMLSTLGAWMDLRGEWDLLAEMGLSVQEWRHRGTLGRDHYVRVVYKGFLLPFMHGASLIKITERKFHPDSPGNTAYLRQRMFILVRQPEKTYLPTGVRNPANELYDLAMPFTWVRINTLVTPNLEDPSKPPSDVSGLGQDMFWPHVGAQPFFFHLTGEDMDGRLVEFNAPLMFVSTDKDIAYNLNPMQDAKTDIKNRPLLFRQYNLNGQKMAFADSLTPGDTTFETNSLTFEIEVPNDARYDALRVSQGSYDIPRAYPRLAGAQVSIPAIRHLAGVQQAAGITLHHTYLEKGFAKNGNNAQVFFQLDGGGVGMDFSSQGERSGGLLQPNLQIKGLSRLMGPVSGDNLDKLTGGEFNAEDFFKGLGAKIFGVLNLWDIVDGIGAGGLADALDKVPRLLTENLTAAATLLKDLDNLKKNVDALAPHLGTLPADLAADYAQVTSTLSGLVSGSASSADLELALQPLQAHLGQLKNALPGLPTAAPADVARELEVIVDGLVKELASVSQFVQRLVKALQVPDEVRVTFEWKPIVKDWNDIFIAQNARNGDKAATLVLRAELQAASNFKPDPSYNMLCSLENFTLDLIGSLESFIRIYFRKIEFTASSAKKPDVDVKMDGIEFVGVLSFVEALRSLIPLDGFSDPPSLQVDETGVRASFSLALPNIAFGVFSLQNLSLGAGLTVPFLGDPLSVRFNFCERQSPFLLTVTLFGGGGFFAITLDPAGVQVLEASFEFGANIAIDFGVASGGVYVMAGIYYAIKSGNAELTGYFRMGGSLSVLGLITASIELYLELKYQFSSGKLTGKATLTIEVEVLFFSASVSISCERKFAGSNGDPTFRQVMEPYTHPVTGQPVLPWHEYCAAFA